MTPMGKITVNHRHYKSFLCGHCVRKAENNCH